MQTLKIDMLKFTGARHFKSKDGTDHIAIPVAANDIYVGAKGSYLNLTLIENREGKDAYDNDGFAAVSLTKERRDAGEKGPIVGNWRNIVIEDKPQSSNASFEPKPDDSDDIPF
jgi:hypothetical protein